MNNDKTEYIKKLLKQSLERTKTCLPKHTKMCEDTFGGSHKLCKFFDEKYGYFWCLPLNIYKGVLHPDRGRKKALQTKRNNILKKHLENKKIPEGVSIDEETFVGITKLCRFVDTRYGYWWTIARNVLEGGCGHPDGTKEKRKNTLIKKYGVDSTLKNKALFDKAMKSQSKTEIKIHWKTGLELICTASYECFVVDYLNTNKIDYKWQEHAFLMSDGRTYRPDLYLEKDCKYVEIKGIFWKDAREKWDWFHKKYENSEIWDEQKLVSLGYKRKRNV